MSAFQRQGAIMKEISQMVRDHIFRTVLKKAPKERIAEMLRVVNCHKSVETFRDGPEFSFYDLLDLVDAAGIDIGFTIRMRDGEEVTFYPGHNFGKTGGKNGTPHENRVAKKPYEYENTTYDYNTNRNRRGGVAKSAVAGLGLVDQRAGCRHVAEGLGGVYAPEADYEDLDAVVGQIGPKLPKTPLLCDVKKPKIEPPCSAANPKVLELPVINKDGDGRGEN